MAENLNTIEYFTDTAAFISVSQHFYNETKSSQSNESVSSNNEDLYEIERWINVFALPVIVAMGTIGNMITFFCNAMRFIEGCINLFLHGNIGFN